MKKQMKILNSPWTIALLSIISAPLMPYIMDWLLNMGGIVVDRILLISVLSFIVWFIMALLLVSWYKKNIKNVESVGLKKLAKMNDKIMQMQIPSLERTIIIDDIVYLQGCNYSKENLTLSLRALVHNNTYYKLRTEGYTIETVYKGNSILKEEWDRKTSESENFISTFTNSNFHFKVPIKEISEITELWKIEFKLWFKFSFNKLNIHNELDSPFERKNLNCAIRFYDNNYQINTKQIIQQYVELKAKEDQENDET